MSELDLLFHALETAAFHEARSGTASDFEKCKAARAAIVAHVSEERERLLTELARLRAQVEQLRAAIGVCVPSIIRCYRDVAEERYQVDVPTCDKVLVRIERAMAATSPEIA